MIWSMVTKITEFQGNPKQCSPTLTPMETTRHTWTWVDICGETGSLFEQWFMNILNCKKMGTIKKGIMGGFSGKVGNIVGASWKGIAYIRSLPASVHNPRTEKQVTQRNKFSLIGRLTKFCDPYLPSLTKRAELFRKLSEQKTSLLGLCHSEK